MSESVGVSESVAWSFGTIQLFYLIPFWGLKKNTPSFEGVFLGG